MKETVKRVLPMKESAAWRRLAEELDSKALYLRAGLCLLLDSVSWLDGDTRRALYTRLDAHSTVHEDCSGPFTSWNEQAYIDTPGTIPSRVLACLFFALEAKDEGK